MNVANQWRADALPGDTTNTLTVAALQQVYADYSHLAAEMALQNNDNTLAVSALAVLAENRAASLREQLRTAYSEKWEATFGIFRQTIRVAGSTGRGDARQKQRRRQGETSTH